MPAGSPLIYESKDSDESKSFAIIASLTSFASIQPIWNYPLLVLIVTHILSLPHQIERLFRE